MCLIHSQTNKINTVLYVQLQCLQCLCQVSFHYTLSINFKQESNQQKPVYIRSLNYPLLLAMQTITWQWPAISYNKYDGGLLALLSLTLED